MCPLLPDKLLRIARAHVRVTRVSELISHDGRPPFRIAVAPSRLPCSGWPLCLLTPPFSPAVLQLKLQQRRTREELVSQGIMPRKSHPLTAFSGFGVPSHRVQMDYLDPHGLLPAWPDRS